MTKKNLFRVFLITSKRILSKIGTVLSMNEDDSETENRKKSKKRRMRKRISSQLAEVASSYGLVRFQPLVVTDDRLIKNIISQVWLFQELVVSNNVFI